MSETKFYEVERHTFEFSPNGSPLVGLMSTTSETGTYIASLDLQKSGSRKNYASEAEELYSFDGAVLRRALNEICTLRTAEIAAAADAGEEEPEHAEELSDEAEALVTTAGVLERYADEVARIRGVVRDREPLKLQCLVGFGAQLAPFASGRPAGANLILTAEAGRGKNYICDAAATALPDEFFMSFESASAKSLYYQAERDPSVLKHRWLYPNEAEGTDLLVETLRPILSGGKASHLTVNKTSEGRNASQELNIEGPITVTIPTVRNKLDGQLQTRMLVAELEDYEGRVAQHSRAVSRLLLPGQAGEDNSGIIEAWKAALRSLTARRRVVFPLDHEEFCFSSDTVSHGARLWTNLLGLMLANAWLEQRNRETLDLSDGEKAIVATPEDYEVAYDVFRATCERSVVNLSDTHRAILDAVYELSCQSAFDGFSLRKIAEAAGVHHSTVAEHKTYLTKSVKLLKEVEGGGLDLIAGADPSWWRKDDLLVGFPRPAQVRRWYEEGVSSSTESARQARQHTSTADKADTYAEKGVGHPTRQKPDATRQSGQDTDNAPLSGRETAVSDEPPDSKSRIDKGNTVDERAVSGVSGSFEEGKDPCIHNKPGGIGCYSCDPCHPYSLKESGTDPTESQKDEIRRLVRSGMSKEIAYAEVLGVEMEL